MHKVRDFVLNRKKALERIGGDTTIQELLVSLAGAYETLDWMKDREVETTKKLADDVDRMFDDNSELMESIEEDLAQHDEALRRLRLQTTLLEGIGLGVSRHNFLNQ